MQELRVESAERVVQESGLQLHSQRMELYKANLLSDQSQTEKNRLWTELDRREGVLREDRVRNFQEIEELAMLRCAEAEKAKQLSKDGISIQEKESQSTVNQLTVQIQELQDKVNTLSDAREFYDPCNGKQSWVIPRFQSSYAYSESSWNA